MPCSSLSQALGSANCEKLYDGLIIVVNPINKIFSIFTNIKMIIKKGGKNV